MPSSKQVKRRASFIVSHLKIIKTGRIFIKKDRSSYVQLTKFTNYKQGKM